MDKKKNKLQDAIDNTLIEQRKVFLWGMVNDQSAKHVIDRLFYLDAINNEEIQLYINSPGGYVTSGFAMYDTIKQIKSPVSTICTGLAASMGSLLLSVGEKGRRFIQPHARAFEQIMKDFQRDHWMGAQESVEYGIVDGLIEG